MALTPGKYKAKAVEGAFGKVGKNETSAVGIKFLVDGGEEIWHTMYLTNTKTSNGLTVFEHTMNTLVVTLGFNENKDLLKRTDGSVYFDKSFLADKEVSLTLEEETYDGKTRVKIRWVNELGGGNMAGVSVQSVLGNISLKEAAMAARARMGTKTQASVHQEEAPF